jgi:hypothetical protein
VLLHSKLEALIQIPALPKYINNSREQFYRPEVAQQLIGSLLEEIRETCGEKAGRQGCWIEVPSFLVGFLMGISREAFKVPGISWDPWSLFPGI